MTQELRIPGAIASKLLQHMLHEQNAIWHRAVQLYIGWFSRASASEIESLALNYCQACLDNFDAFAHMLLQCTARAESDVYKHSLGERIEEALAVVDADYLHLPTDWIKEVRAELKTKLAFKKAGALAVAEPLWSSLSKAKCPNLYLFARSIAVNPMTPRGTWRPEQTVEEYLCETWEASEAFGGFFLQNGALVVSHLANGGQPTLDFFAAVLNGQLPLESEAKDFVALMAPFYCGSGSSKHDRSALANRAAGGAEQNELLRTKTLDRSKWNEERRRVVEAYEEECRGAGHEAITIASIFKEAGISQSSNGYAALRGGRIGDWRKIKQICAVRKPHLARF